jgi:hypothetical protein
MLGSKRCVSRLRQSFAAFIKLNSVQKSLVHGSRMPVFYVLVLDAGAPRTGASCMHFAQCWYLIFSLKLCPWQRFVGSHEQMAPNKAVHARGVHEAERIAMHQNSRLRMQIARRQYL